MDGHLWLYRMTGQPRQMHHHAELEFNLVTHGTGTYLLDDRRYELVRQSLVWLFPAQEHVLLQQSADFEMWIGVFKPRLIAAACTGAEDRLLHEANPPGHYCRRLPLAVMGLLSDLCAQVHQSGRPNLRNAGFAYLLLRTWEAYLAAEDIPARSDVHPAVERAAQLIAENPGGQTLEELAAHAGLSATRLSRLFKSQTGVALVDFRNRKRIERFLEVYGSGQRMKMLEAALAAGFGSYPQFHRVFKKVMGCSPADYRREL
jgi:AraC-like DNA-binding protein